MSIYKAFSLLLVVQLGRCCVARSETACLTRRKCNQQRKELGFASFFIGNYQTKGCFSKGSVAYFGTGGSRDDKAEPDLAGVTERIWCGGDSSNGTTKATTKPTQEPTKEPTSAPTNALDPALFGEGNAPREDCVEVRVQFNTGRLDGGKAGLNLSQKAADDPSSGVAVWYFPVGSLEGESEYAPGPACLPRGTYALSIVGRGTYSAHVDGEEVLFGSSRPGKTSAHDIVVGYEAAMTDAEEAWLNEHNRRRAAFHERHGREYRPLTWSRELADSASDWADRILPTCQFDHEPDLRVGENVALNHYSGFRGPSDNEVPATILARWSDRKLDKEYPDNQTLTQVMWRGTRHLGCATKHATDGDGNYCYVSICRYSRPGNCNMKQNNWLDLTLQDRSPCGEACPEEGCH